MQIVRNGFWHPFLTPPTYRIGFKRVTFVVTLFLILGILSTPSYSRFTESEPPHIAILEFTGNYDDTSAIDPSEPGVNFLFEKDGKKWNGQGSYSITEYDWTVALEGRTLGNIRSEFKGMIGMPPGRHTIASSFQIPKIGRPSNEFTVWSSIGPAYRPLILVSKPNYEDPEKWKGFTPTREQVLSLVPHFREQVRVAHACEKTNPKIHPPKAFNYPTEWVTFIKAYRSVHGNSIFGFRLDPANNHCADPKDSNWSPHWFYLHKGQPKFIGNEMRPLDAGDYDRDGRSEFIFQVSRYNTYGYVLFYDDFSQFVYSPGIR